MIPFLGELSPAGERVVGKCFQVVLLPLLSSVGWCAFPHPLGGAASSPLLCWVVLLCSSFLWGGTAWLPPSLGRGAFSPRPLGRFFFFFFKKTK